MQAVIVNVAVSTGIARDLGVEGHICEVQLMLDVWPFMRVRFHTQPQHQPPFL